MTSLADERLRGIAERVVWFQLPEHTLAPPGQFLAHVMQYGSLGDVTTVMKYYPAEAFTDALDAAPAGLFTPRSWAFWNLRCGRWPAPPLPARRLHPTANASR